MIKLKQLLTRKKRRVFFSYRFCGAVSSNAELNEILNEAVNMAYTL